MIYLSKSSQALLGSWVRAFVAGSVALAMTGNYEFNDLWRAGLAAVLPVIYNWANNKDERYGRGHHED